MAQLRRKERKQKRALIFGIFIALAVAGVSLYSKLQASFVIEREAESARTSGTAVATNTLAATEDAALITSVLIVHIDGAVQTPGVYELKESARVQDAVMAAGGLAQDADTSTINLASRLVDGQKIHVPSAQEVSEASLQSNGTTSTLSSSTTSLVNINTATAEELETLPGVGPSTAATIIQDREQSGAFSSIEDIMRISGIGEKKFAKIKEYICV